MARKGQFKKGGGRVGAARKARSHSKAVTKYRTRTNTVTRYRSRPAKRHHRRRHARRSGGLSPLMMGALAVGAAYITGPKGPAMVTTNIAKVPGAATFGPLAVLGAGGLAYDRFIRPNKYAKALGIIGIIGAAMKVGERGADFSWVGDEETGDIDETGDVGDDDDVSDVGDDDDDY
jgi:hypothetical protein